MKRLKNSVIVVAFIVLLICIYVFLLGNDVFKGKFTNDGFAWYFLAKGIFCSLNLYLLVCLLESFSSKKE